MKWVPCDQQHDKEQQDEFMNKEIDDLVFGHV